MKNVKKYVLVAVASFCLLVGVAILPTLPTSAASQSGGFGGRPANPDPANPRTESIFIYTIERGDSKNDQIQMSNNSLSPVTINIYAVDGVVTNTGAYTCKQDSEARVDIGKWLKLKTSKVTLQPDQKQLVDFTLTMPNNADVGEHDGCIVFENADDKGQVVSGGGVRIHTRQAVRVVATVPGKLNRDIGITKFDFNSQKTPSLYTVTLKNTGNVSADVDLKVKMTNLFGGTSYENKGGYPVLPNESLTQQFTDSQQPLFGGWYYVQASIAYDKRAGMFGTADSAQLVHKQTEKQLVFLWPSTAGWVVLIAVVAIIGVGIVTLLTRRKNTKKKFAQWAKVRIGADTSIEALALRYHAEWKDIARVNKLKAPYSIKAGTVLRLPKPTDTNKL